MSLDVNKAEPVWWAIRDHVRTEADHKIVSCVGDLAWHLAYNQIADPIFTSEKLRMLGRIENEITHSVNS